MITANGVELCTEAFGDPADPTLLLVMGATASMLRWEDDLCRRLADGGRYVIRYDNRDTGRSTTYAPGEVPYTLEDLADDAVGVLDAYGIETAHIVGVSMGGMITQHIALRHPERVRTITPIMSTPDPTSIFAAVDGGPASLPGPTPELLTQLVATAMVDADDDAARLDAYVALSAVLERPRFHDPDAARAMAVAERRRARDIRSAQNHAIAVGNSPAWRDRIGTIAVPTLVLHGTDDPILPFPHGEALAAEIPGARLVPLEGAGHDLPRELWDVIVPAILEHTAA